MTSSCSAWPTPDVEVLAESGNWSVMIIRVSVCMRLWQWGNVLFELVISETEIVYYMSWLINHSVEYLLVPCLLLVLKSWTFNCTIVVLIPAVRFKRCRWWLYFGGYRLQGLQDRSMQHASHAELWPVLCWTVPWSPGQVRYLGVVLMFSRWWWNVCGVKS